jgi:hypothetical protein
MIANVFELYPEQPQEKRILATIDRWRLRKALQRFHQSKLMFRSQRSSVHVDRALDQGNQTLHIFIRSAEPTHLPRV